MKNLYDSTALSADMWINTTQYTIKAEDEGEAPAPAPPPTAEGEAPAPAAEGEGETKPDDGKKPWFMERIDGLTRQKHELQAAHQTLAQQNAALRQTVETLLAQGATPQQAAEAAGQHAEALGDAGNAGAGRQQQGMPRERLFTQAEIEQLAQQRAYEMAQGYVASQSEQAFNARCNQIAATAKAQYQDFDAALANLSAAGVLPNGQLPMQQQTAQRTFLETVTEFDEAPALLHYLGRNPEEAIQIASLRPAAMAARLSKIASKMTSPRAPSNAPPPVTTARGTSAPRAPTLDDKNISMDDWIKLREENMKRR